MEFVLTRYHFCSWFFSSNYIESIKLVFKPVFPKQFHFLKPLNIYITLLKWAKKVLQSAKKVTLRDANEDVDNGLYRGTKHFCQRRWKTYSTQFLTSFNAKHLLLWTTPKTLEIEWRNRLKEQRIRKVELSRVKYSHAFVSTLNYVSPISANNDKRRCSWDGQTG